jgi:hypothetical protein
MTNRMSLDWGNTRLSLKEEGGKKRLPENFAVQG